MEQYIVPIILTIIFIDIGFEAYRGQYRTELSSGKDKMIMIINILFAPTVIKPIIEVTMGLILIALIPSHAGSWATMAFGTAFLIYFVSEDFAQYVVHRMGHKNRFFWGLHRTHHTGRRMNSGLLLRTNVFWVFCLPATWFGTAAIYLGMIEAYIAAFAIKISLSLINHSYIYRWDNFLRSFKATRPLMWVMERIFVTPRTHQVHHALGLHGKPNKNFGTSLIIWDQLFGTAYIPDADPKNFGLPIGDKLKLSEELFWPLVKAEKKITTEPDLA